MDAFSFVYSFVDRRENNILRHQLLIGTMTNQEQNHLLVCAIDIPDRSKTESGGEQAAKYEGTLYVVKRINHEGKHEGSNLYSIAHQGIFIL